MSPQGLVTEAGFRTFAELAPDAVLLADVRGVIRFANLECERLFRYNRQELAGKSIEQLVPERFREGHVAHRADHAKTPKKRRLRSGLELFARRKDGTEFPAEISLSPIHTESGLMTCAMVRDMTEVKELLEKARRTSERLAAANAELEQFASIAAHDLQEPLRTIAGASHQLADQFGPQLGAEGQEQIDNLLQGARRMQLLLDALRDYARAGIPTLPLRPFSLGNPLRSAIGNLKALIDSTGARLTAEPLPNVPGDEVRLTQVFQNLISNAVKFSGPEPPRIHVSAQDCGREWEISVKDNGIGIDPRHFQRLFVVFQRLHPRDRFPGMGMGLAICKKIVEQHGGSIWVESSHEEGTIFHFTLPKEPRDAANQGPVSGTDTQDHRAESESFHPSRHRAAAQHAATGSERRGSPG